MKTETKNIIISFGKLAAISLGVYILMRCILPALLPFFIAAALAVLLHPLAEKLHKKTGLKRKICSLLVFLLFIVILVVVLAVIFYLICSQASKLFLGYDNLGGQVRELGRLCENTISDLCGANNTVLKQRVMAEISAMASSLGRRISSAVMEMSFSSVRTMGTVLLIILITLVSAVLILNDYASIAKKTLAHPAGKKAVEILKNIGHAGGSYFKAQFKIIACITGICILGLFLTGNRYALPAGIGIGICDALPFLGTGTIFVPWAIINLLQKEYAQAFFHIAIYLVCLVSREFLEAKLIGKGVGLHPLMVLISIYVGIFVYGGAGVLLGPASVLLIREIYCSVQQETADHTSEKSE